MQIVVQDQSSDIKKKILAQVIRLNGFFVFNGIDAEKEFDELVAGNRVFILDEDTIYVFFETFDKCGDAKSAIHFSKDIVVSVSFSFMTRKNYTHPVAKKWRNMLVNQSFLAINIVEPKTILPHSSLYMYPRLEVRRKTGLLYMITELARGIQRTDKVNVYSDLRYIIK